MGPILPIALAATAIYALKRHFDTKTATPAPGAGGSLPGAYDPSGGPLPGASSGGGGGAPGDPGYPMSTDPTYNPQPAQPLSMGQIAKALAPLTQARLATSATIAQKSPAKLGTFADRASSVLIDASPAPAPAPAPAKTFASITAAVAPAAPMGALLPRGTLPGKTFSK